MAICKHLSSKRGFAVALEYLTMQHNTNGYLLLDVEGLPVPRENYLINGIHCIPETFAPLCLRDRIQFHKKRNNHSIDTHQYILSFAPSDIEKGLTMEEAQQFGLAFARKNFPGHRILVCTHPDGGKGSGNIHAHIVISAIRFEDRSPDERFMQLRSDGSVKPSGYKAGCAHQDTAKFRIHLLAQVNHYCQSRGYTVCPEKAPTKVNQGEYLLMEKGIETHNAQLRRAIADAATTSRTWDEFTAKLKQDYTYTAPALPPIPFPLRQRLWNDYKETTKDFEEWERLRRTSYQSQLNDAFAALKNCTSRSEKAEIRKNIEELKISQAKLRLYRKTFQTYVKAASAALKSQNQEDAMLCLEQMKDLTARQNGYWKEGFFHSADSFSLVDGPLKSRITWKQLDEQDLLSAQRILEAVQEEAQRRNMLATELVELPMPIEVKLSHGEVSFRHPASEYWVRGARLGNAYTLESLGISLPRTHSPQYGKSLEYSR